jgi:hypothetical protein
MFFGSGSRFLEAGNPMSNTQKPQNRLVVIATVVGTLSHLARFVWIVWRDIFLKD